MQKVADIGIAPIYMVGGITATPDPSMGPGFGRRRWPVQSRRHGVARPRKGEREVGIFVPERLHVISMNFKNEYTLPSHMAGDQGLPRNREERLLWIRRKVQDGYYDEDRVIRAVADAFLEPGEGRRAGDQS